MARSGWWFQRRREVTAPDPTERSAIDGIRYEDLAVIDQLTALGAELLAPRHVIFYLYFPAPEAAERAGDALREAGLTVGLPGPAPEYPGSWPVRAESHERALIPDFLRETTDLCRALAADGGGEYDGWEAGLTEAEAAKRG